MTFADLSAMLADAAQQPAFILVCGLIVILGAGWAAVLGRRAADEEDLRIGLMNEAERAFEETMARHEAQHRPAPMRTADAALIEQQCSDLRMRRVTPPAQRRIRAISEARLKPSYDSRKTGAAQ